MKNDLKYNDLRGFNYNYGSDILRIICPDTVSDILYYPIENKTPNIIYKNLIFDIDFSVKIQSILKKMTNNSFDIFIIDIPIVMDIGIHQNLIFIEIIENNIYLFGYDPLGNYYENYFGHVLYKTMSYISDVIKIYISQGNIIRNRNINNIFIKISNKKTIFQLFNDGTFGKYNPGYCMIYTSFIFYLLFYITCNWSKKYIPRISIVIDLIETYLLKLYNENNIYLFIKILKQFSYNCFENYYINVFTLIDQIYINKTENNNVKKILNFTIEENFKNLFKLYFLENVKNDEYKENEILDLDVLRYSGYSCKKDSDCISEKCKNGICDFVFDKFSEKNLRSVGNPCLYDSQCKTNSCIENIFSGDYEEEMYAHKEDLEKKYGKKKKIEF